MAEFSLGLTKTAVEGTLSLVKSAVEEEKRLRDMVQNDLEFITSEFDVMRSFLRVANREHTANDEVALALVRQLRTLAFDVEDCVEFIIHLDKPSRWEWLRRAWNTVYWCAPPRPLDDVVAEMKQLKARVGDLRLRNLHYNNLIRDSSIRAEEPGSTCVSSVLFHILRDAWKASGKWCHSMCNLQELISREGDDLHVISIGGGGDLGTASIIRMAYYDPEICANFKSRAWVKLTHPFNHDEFIKSLLAQFYVNSHQAYRGVDCWTEEMMKANAMENNLNKAKFMMQQMKKQRYLVVLEDVLTSEEWDVVRMYLPDNNNGSRIVVSTPQLGIALLCTGEPYQVSDLTHFSDGRFICAFFKKEYDSLFSYNNKSQRSQKATKECSNEFQLVGRRMEEQELVRLVYSNGLVSVWGIAGVGKSSLVTKVYQMIHGGHKTSNLQCSFKSFGWVDVPDPFNLTQLCCLLLVNFYSVDSQAKETAAVGLMEQSLDPIQECFKFIHKQKCLVVIDGLRSTQDWDKIRAALLSEPITGTIVVITSAEKVAIHCVQNVQGKVLNIRRLEADAALYLLARKIALDYGPLTFEETEVTGSIVTKCGGLPKVITAIGEACSSQLQVLRNDSSYKYCMWPPGGTFISDLEIEPEFHGLRPLFSWMQSYFDACSDSIKPCIFYLSIFPPVEKKNIRRRRLLWRWITEGYCRDTSDGSTCEENGENYISELVNLSIIQESPINKAFCEINGFFHEYIISRPMEDNLVFALEKDCSLNSTRAGQHLTIRRGWDRKDKIVFESIDFSRLRSLTVFGKWELFFISSKNIEMRLLRVLDLEDATDVTNEDLEQITKLLRRLKFLSIRGHTKITCLPSSIGGLRQLQTLDIRHTSIVMLQPVITKLQKLRYIRAGTSTTEVWDWNEGDLLVPVDGEEDTASAAAQATNLPTTAGTPTIEDEDHALEPIEDGEDRASSFPEVTNFTDTGATEEHTSEPQENDVINLPTEGGTGNSATTAECSRPRTLVSSLLSKFRRRGGGGLDNNNNGPVAAGVTVLAEEAGSSVSCNNRSRTLASSLLCRGCGVDNGGVMVDPAAGVTVPADIGNLAFMHTLGVVKVSAQCSKDSRAIFQEIKKLTQLRKLGVSGINSGNITELCSAISVLSHLKSLSVELDKDDDKLDALGENDILEPPPKSIKSLKLYGRVQKLLLAWSKHLNHLERLKLDVTIRKPEEFRFQEPPEPSDRLPVGHLRIRPIEAGELQIGRRWLFFAPDVVEVQCSSDLRLEFDRYQHIKVLKVHFSGGSISGLSKLPSIEEVWLKGHSDAHKQYMQQQIDGMSLLPVQKRPVLKLVQTRSSC